jgi:Domain of unknown function (DUF5655)
MQETQETKELTDAADYLFSGKEPNVHATYQEVLTSLRTIGPFAVEPKKSSIHLVRSSGFAGVHPRKGYLYLNLRLDRALSGPRIAKTEQVSKNRWHNEIRLDSPEQVDEELRGWLREAYTLA